MLRPDRLGRDEEALAGRGPTGRKIPLQPLIWTAVLLACLGLGGLAGWASWKNLESSSERARVTSENPARVLTQHTARMVESVDMLLKLVARELGPDAGNAARRSATSASLAYLTQDLPHVMALRVLDGASGEVLFDFIRAREVAAPNDFALVAEHKTRPHVPLLVGKPVKDTAQGYWLLPVSRRISGREGIPGNIAVAYLSLDHFQSFIAQLEMGRDASVTLVRTDGVMVARRPFREAYFGRDITASPLFSAGYWVLPSGSYETVSVADGIARRFVFRRVGDLPLIITVGASKADLMAGWASQAKRDLSLALGAILLLLVSSAFLSLEVGRRDAAEKALSEGEARLRLALQAARVVAWERDLATGFVTRSDNARELLGFGSGPVAEMLARIHPDDRERVMAAATHGNEGAEYRFTRDDGVELWLATRGQPREDRSGSVVGVTYDITDRKLAEEQAWRAAHSDALTGLANRAFFQAELARRLHGAKESGGSIALLLLDLDDFKAVNDTYGHDAGDALLMETAARIMRDLTPPEFAARLGGDEFAVVLCDRSPGETETVARAMLRALQEPVQYGDLALTSRASIGLARYPDHDAEPAELMKDADMALYAAKSQGRSRVVAYVAEMRQALQRRASVARDMLHAIAERRIVPYYQPKICLSTGSIVGFEALARWRHPREGLLTPASFGSAFDDPDLSVAIGRRMLEQIADDMRGWLEAGLPCGRIALNLSTAEFREPGLGTVLLERIATAGIATQHLAVEVTETVFLGRSSDHVAAALEQLRDAGVLISLDDFGTGFASLTPLKQFPVDEIKIDRAFVRDMERDRDDCAIVSAVIGLGRSLGLSVVAEGVETAGQAQALREQGCHFAQGHLFARPMAASRVPWLLTRGQPALRASSAA